MTCNCDRIHAWCSLLWVCRRHLSCLTFLCYILRACLPRFSQTETLTWIYCLFSQSETWGITFTSMVARQQKERERKRKSECVRKRGEVVAEEKNSRVVAKRRGEIWARWLNCSFTDSMPFTVSWTCTRSDRVYHATKVLQVGLQWGLVSYWPDLNPAEYIMTYVCSNTSIASLCPDLVLSDVL